LKYIFSCISLFLLVFIAGCSYNNIYNTTDYDIQLTKVEHPKDSLDHEVITSKNLKYEDNKISVTWIPRGDSFRFTLENKSDSSIKIVWDDCVFVDENGINHKTIHSGIKFIDRNNSQPPSTIIKGGKIIDEISPSDYIAWQDYPYSGWVTTRIFPDNLVSDGIEKQNRIETANSYIGKIFKVVLSLYSEGINNEYIFIFQIKKFEVKRL